jgi:acylphosphatase
MEFKMEVAYEVNVSGRVQGVGFRWNTRNQARNLGVVGWVRNNPDRSVSAHVQGDEERVAEMLDFLRHGPVGSRVDNIRVNQVPLADDHAGEFIVRFM